MTAEQLEELLGKVTQGEWSVESRVEGDEWFGVGVYDASGREIVWMENDPEPDDYICQLIALSPSLARRVIAAEKLVEALQTARDYVSDAHIGGLVYDDGKRVSDAMTTEDLAMIDSALTAYREASK